MDGTQGRRADDLGTPRCFRRIVFPRRADRTDMASILHFEASAGKGFDLEVCKGEYATCERGSHRQNSMQGCQVLAAEGEEGFSPSSVLSFAQASFPSPPSKPLLVVYQIAAHRKHHQRY